MSPESLPRRSATVEVMQLMTGYWLGEVTVRVPGWPDQKFSNDLFHTAGDALDWARLTIETAVASVTAAPPIYRSPYASS